MIAAVVFDLDGVLLDSEGSWDKARRQTVDEQGGRWPEGATEAMQGMSSAEWSAYLRMNAGVKVSQDAIIESVVDMLLIGYRRNLPMRSGAREAVERLASRWPLGLASSSNRRVIDTVLESAGLNRLFQATVSSEEVERGKPAPDVYLEAARRLQVLPVNCAAVEDSTNGIRSAGRAGMSVVAIPNPDYPPDPKVLGEADVVMSGLDDLTPDRVKEADERRRRRAEEHLDEQEVESFPASDPHADWAGPPG